MKSSRRHFTASLDGSLSAVAVAVAVAIGLSLYAVPAFAQETIKVCVLHARSGTMAI